jgi:hypothetical protein
LVDNSWVGVKTVDELPDKEVKIGFDGEYLSQNELLRNNDNELAKAMYFNFDVFGVVKLAEGLVGIDSSNVLYLILKRFKNAGYPINEATKQLNESKLFV